MKRINSVKFKVSIPVILVLILVFILSSLIIIQRESQVAEETTLTSALSFAALSVEEVTTNYIDYYDSGFFRYSQVITNLFELNKDIEKIQLLDVNGNLLFDSDEVVEGKYEESLYGPRVITDEQILTRLENIEPSMISDSFEDNSIIIVQPYLDDNGKHEFSVVFDLSLQGLRSLETQMILTTSYYSAFFFVVSFVVIYLLFSHYITSPLGQLMDGVKEIKKGDLEYQIDIASSDELGALASEFNKMTSELKLSQETLEEYSRNLERLVEQRNELIIQLSHDLKTPLGPISTMSSLLFKSEADESRKEMLEVISRNAEYMKNIVIKTIDLVRLNSPESRLSLEQVNLTDLIGKVLKAKKHLLRDKKIELIEHLNEDISVFGDRLALEELLANIFENAVKYNKAGGKIVIEANRKDEMVELLVTDTGVGLSEDQAKKVFEEFYKADESRHDFESSGLGLTIAKRIVDLHRGKIFLTSEGLGKGTTVHVKLPLSTHRDDS